VRRITIDAHGELSVLDHGGSGPLVVCVHGLEGSAYNWNLIGPDLAEDHRVVAPDLSGFGHSLPLDRGATVEANTQVVADVIEHFGGPALLIGNSMGGLISMQVALHHPDLVRALVLIDPAAPVTNWLTVRPHAAARLSTPLLPWIGSRIVDLYRSRLSVDASIHESLNFVAADAAALDPRVWQDAREMTELRRTRDYSTDVLVEAVNSIAPYVLRKPRFAKMLHRITQPTLIIHGTEDDLIQIQTAHWIARQRPDWTAAFFEGVGHVPMLEVPDRLMSVIRTWEHAAVPAE
jgi:pimeloyl-ACP methyl ester carboxylesterase